MPRSTRRRLVPAAVLLGLVALTLTFAIHAASRTAADDGGPRVVTIEGRVDLADGPAVVEVLVVVDPAEDADARAREALRDVAPGAVAVQEQAELGNGLRSDTFTTTGLVWDTLPVSVQYNPAGSTVADGLSPLLAALGTWTDVTTSSFAYAYGGTTTRCPSLYDGCPGAQVFDGFNDVGWDDIPAAGVLGVTWSGSFPDEMDVVIDTGFAWHTGAPPVPYGAIDLESVQLHELGHGAGLGHSTVAAAVMAPSIASGTAKRVLHQDDIDGLSFLYPGASPTGTSTPTPAATPTPTLVDPGNDSDTDGCSDGKETGSVAALGGLRDPSNFWDFMDVWTPDRQHPGQYERDKAVTIEDIVQVAARFLASGTQTGVADALTPPMSATAYHASYDVGAQNGPHNWNRGPANGTISVDDIAAVASQFLHSC